ncbi:hypothetical protein ECDEC10B_5947 [Escherichia coli DEC10B]|nr:hypothetical protein ECDEC10B_5947 [Escherichia coli DEC10B]
MGPLIFTLWFWRKGKDRGKGISEIISGGIKKRNMNDISW